MYLSKDSPAEFVAAFNTKPPVQLYIPICDKKNFGTSRDAWEQQSNTLGVICYEFSNCLRSTYLAASKPRLLRGGAAMVNVADVKIPIEFEATHYKLLSAWRGMHAGPVLRALIDCCNCIRPACTGYR